MNIGILGAGAWGTALAILSAKSGNTVTLWSHSGNVTEFEGVEVPSGITVTRDMNELIDTDCWLIATPARYFRETIQKSRDFYDCKPIIICSKGIEPTTNKFMSEILNEEIPECEDYGVLSGPQFAREAVMGVPTGTTLAGNETAIECGKIALSQMYIEETDDVIGAEVCGVGKNACALIAGYASIAASGENEKALILTCAWNEVVKFGARDGAKPETYLALCGLGDLFLSATSPTSRNFAAGIAIARGEPIMGTVEGISALNGLVKRAGERNIEIPFLTDMREKLKI